jgi:hypothetical protein
LFAGGAVVYGAGTGLVSISTRKAMGLEAKLSKIMEHRKMVDALAEACHSRWRLNENYLPMMVEVRAWMETIMFHDEVLADSLHYASLIDLESSGNPTVLVKRWNARGLGCVRHDIAKDLVKRLGMKVKAVGSALFNPQFNIFCMIRIFEECYAKAVGPDRIKRALNYYIMGKARTDKHIAAGKEPDRYIDLYNERKEAIGKLMKRRMR